MRTLYLKSKIHRAKVTIVILIMRQSGPGFRADDCCWDEGI